MADIIALELQALDIGSGIVSTITSWPQILCTKERAEALNCYVDNSDNYYTAQNLLVRLKDLNRNYEVTIIIKGKGTVLGEGFYKKGLLVTITATNLYDYEFLYFITENKKTINPIYTFSIDKDIIIEAVFAAPVYTKISCGSSWNPTGTINATLNNNKYCIESVALFGRYWQSDFIDNFVKASVDETVLPDGKIMYPYDLTISGSTVTYTGTPFKENETHNIKIYTSAETATDAVINATQNDIVDEPDWSAYVNNSGSNSAIIHPRFKIYNYISIPEGMDVAVQNGFFLAQSINSSGQYGSNPSLENHYNFIVVIPSTCTHTKVNMTILENNYLTYPSQFDIYLCHPGIEINFVSDTLVDLINFSNFFKEKIKNKIIVHYPLKYLDFYLASIRKYGSIVVWVSDCLPTNTYKFSAPIYNQRSTYDGNIYTEPDGSKWIRVAHHNNPAAKKFTTNTLHLGHKDDDDRWFCVGICENPFTPNKWEFMVKSKDTSSSPEYKCRWTQNANPMHTYLSSSGSVSITINTSSGYVTNPTSRGLFKYLGTNTFLCGNNSWYGAIGAHSAWNGGIPGYITNTAITTGYIDLYFRIS